MKSWNLWTSVNTFIAMNYALNGTISFSFGNCQQELFYLLVSLTLSEKLKKKFNNLMEQNFFYNHFIDQTKQPFN